MLKPKFCSLGMYFAPQYSRYFGCAPYKSTAQQPLLIGYYLQHLKYSAQSSDTIVAYRPKKKMFTRMSLITTFASACGGDTYPYDGRGCTAAVGFLSWINFALCCNTMNDVSLRCNNVLFLSGCPGSLLTIIQYYFLWLGRHLLVLQTSSRAGPRHCTAGAPQYLHRQIRYLDNIILG